MKLSRLLLTAKTSLDIIEQRAFLTYQTAAKRYARACFPFGNINAVFPSHVVAQSDNELIGATMRVSFLNNTDQRYLSLQSLCKYQVLGMPSRHFSGIVYDTLNALEVRESRKHSTPRIAYTDFHYAEKGDKNTWKPQDEAKALPLLNKPDIAINTLRFKFAQRKWVKQADLYPLFTRMAWYSEAERLANSSPSTLTGLPIFRVNVEGRINSYGFNFIDKQAGFSEEIPLDIFEIFKPNIIKLQGFNLTQADTLLKHLVTCYWMTLLSPSLSDAQKAQILHQWLTKPTIYILHPTSSTIVASPLCPVSGAKVVNTPLSLFKKPDDPTRLHAAIEHFALTS